MKRISAYLTALVVLALAGSAFAQATVGDMDRDLDTDLTDFKKLAECLTGPGGEVSPDCAVANLDGIGGVDQLDFAVLQAAFSPWSRITELSPTDAENMVALTRETIITIPNGVNASTVSNDNVFATFAGTKLTLLNDAPRVTLDGKRVKLFYEPPLPASARVRVTIVGSNIIDLAGHAVDADADGVPGGTRTFDFDTCSDSRIPNTNVEGFVIASERAPGCKDPKDPACDVPLEGVTIWADGFPEDGACDGEPPEEFCAVTDADGHFIMRTTPIPAFFVEVDGMTVTSVGGGAPPEDCSYAREERQMFHSVPGYTIELAVNGIPFKIHLPCVANDSVVPIIAGKPTDVRLGPTGQQAFADMFPDADPTTLSINIPADALVTDDGTPGTMVSVFPVEVDRLPIPLIEGLTPSLMVEIVTDGAMNLDLPAPVCFPNVPDPTTGEPLPPGAKSALLSFNDDTGRWESGGPMTVSDDGQTICSDEGTGLTEFCYHAQAPGTQASGGGGTCGAGGCGDPGCSFAQKLGCGSAVLATVATCVLAAGACTGSFQIPIAAPAVCYGGRVICVAGIGGSLAACLPCFGGAETATRQGGIILEEAQEILDLLANARPIFDQLDAIAITAAPTGAYTAEQLDQIEVLRVELEQLVDGGFFSRANSLITALAEEVPPGSGVDFVDVRPSGPVFYSVYADHLIGARGRTRSDGQFDLILGATLDGVALTFFDPSSWSVGFTSVPVVRPSQPVLFPDYLLTDATDAKDTDGDSLPDVAEHIIGTSFLDPDTDRDGIDDGTEIRQGLNPLDGLPAAIGILASADTPGTAVDICAVNDVAIVADSNTGVTVFDVTAGQAPVAVAQIDTPGTALAVGCSGDLIAVADGPQGLTIIDATDSPGAFITRQVSPLFLGGGTAQAVATLGDVAFVGTKRIGSNGGRVAVVELGTGVVLQRFDMGGTVEDVAIEGSTLYVYANGRLQVMPFVRGLVLETAGSVAVPGSINPAVGRGRLFVGGQIAYVVHRFGYHTFDVSDPSAPALIGLGNTPQLWKQMAVTPARFSETSAGQMLGVAAVGLDSGACRPGRDQVYLYDVSDPTNNNQFLTLFDTPGCAWTVSLFNGQAYVADTSQGLQVINYLAFDTGSAPPTVPKGATGLTALIDGFPRTGGEVTEGKRIVLQAAVLDDVQVRNVEFFVDGERVVADGSFPYETGFRIPVGRIGQTIEITATARDTGGNELSLGPLAFTILADNKPPTVIINVPFEEEVFFVNDVMRIDAVVIDNVEIADVTFEIDGGAVHPQRSSLQTWDMELPRSLGPHTLAVAATDTAGLSASASVTFLIKDRIISREFTAFNDLVNPVTIRDAASREFTARNDLSPPLDIRDAFSREFTAFNDLVNPVFIRDAVSREFTVSVGPEPPP